MIREDFCLHSTAGGIRRQVRVRRSNDIALVKVAPAVWTTALALAGGDLSRIEVIGPNDVRVHNRSR